MIMNYGWINNKAITNSNKQHNKRKRENEGKKKNEGKKMKKKRWMRNKAHHEEGVGWVGEGMAVGCMWWWMLHIWVWEVMIRGALLYTRCVFACLYTICMCTKRQHHPHYPTPCTPHTKNKQEYLVKPGVYNVQLALCPVAPGQRHREDHGTLTVAQQLWHTVGDVE